MFNQNMVTDKIELEENIKFKCYSGKEIEQSYSEDLIPAKYTAPVCVR